MAFFLVALCLVSGIFVATMLRKRRRRRLARVERERTEKAQAFDMRRMAQAQRHYQSRQKSDEPERDPLSKMFGVEVPTFCKPEKRTR